MVDPKALGIVAMDNPQLAGLIITDIRQRLAAKDLLNVMREVGLDTETPSFLFLESLLKSGAIDPDRALQYYLKLQQAQIGLIEMQSKYVDLLLKQAQIRHYNALAMRQVSETETGVQEAVAGQLKAFYEPRLKAIEKEKEEIHSYLRTVANNIRAWDPEKNRILDARLKALELSQQLLAEQQRLAQYYANEYLNEGLNPFTAVTRAVATANAETMEQLSDWASEGTLGLPDTKQVEFGKMVGDEFVRVVSLYVDPNYGKALQGILQMSSGGVVPITSEEKGEPLSWAETVGLSAIAIGTGFGAKKLYEVWKRRRSGSGTEAGARGEKEGAKKGQTKGTVQRVNKALSTGDSRKMLPRGAIPQPSARVTSAKPIGALPSRTQPIELPASTEKSWIDKEAEYLRAKYKLQDNAKVLQEQFEKAIKVIEGEGGAPKPSREGVSPLGRRIGGIRAPVVRGFGVGSIVGTILPMLLEEWKRKDEPEIAPEDQYPVF